MPDLSDGKMHSYFIYFWCFSKYFDDRYCVYVFALYFRSCVMYTGEITSDIYNLQAVGVIASKSVDIPLQYYIHLVSHVNVVFGLALSALLTWFTTVISSHRWCYSTMVHFLSHQIR